MAARRPTNLMAQAERRAGRTTHLLTVTPQNGVFVWCNQQLTYPRMLAKRLKRDDIKIVGPQWLEDQWRGQRVPAIVLDHATVLSEKQWRAFWTIKGLYGTSRSSGESVSSETVTSTAGRSTKTRPPAK